MRRLVGAGLVALLVVGTSACSERVTVAKEVLRYLDATSRLSNRYVYQEALAGQEIVVRGLVEDDFRFKARLTLNDKDILDEVVNDDAMAVRFLDPSVLPQFVKADPGASSSPLELLSQRQWVIDRSGAPPVGLASADNRLAGVDPIVDSLAVLAYTRQAITEAGEENSVRFNPESTEYRPAEDPFPAPKRGSGITRYDVLPRTFPRPDAAQGGQVDASFATVAQFRKMSIYVKDKRVIQVRERIAAEGKILEKFGEYLVAFARQAGLDDAEKQIRQVLDTSEGDQRGQLLLLAYNTGLRQSGREPIRFRSMTYELRDLGAEVEVGLPAGAAEGKLDQFGVNAVQAQEAADQARNAARSGAAGTSATTTTAAP